MESKVSSSASGKTIIAFEGSSVTGIEVNGVYDKNTVVNMAANGNGTDNQESGRYRYTEMGYQRAGNGEDV